ncbi:hypothetical protein [Roseomonas elaeocarpi]|uniref:Uncharacterized protein n=1 Tax=Roseomonas elaeocarpi TaxID=907779 RepID=A0ABV6JY78_9PROT
MRFRPPRVHAFTLRHNLSGLAALGLIEPDHRLPALLPACEALARDLGRNGWPGNAFLERPRSAALLDAAVAEVHAHDPLLWPIPQWSEWHTLLVPASWGCEAIAASMQRAASERHSVPRQQTPFIHHERLPWRPWDIRHWAQQAAHCLRCAAAGHEMPSDGEPNHSVDVLLKLLTRHRIGFMTDPQAVPPPMLVPPADGAAAAQAPA